LQKIASRAEFNCDSQMRQIRLFHIAAWGGSMKGFLSTFCLCFFTMASVSSLTFAQENGGTNNDDHALVQQLQQKIEKLEERLQQVESQQRAAQNSASTNPPQVPVQIRQEAETPTAAAQPTVVDTQAAMAAMDHSSQLPLRIRGYADIGFFANDGVITPENHPSFVLGQFNLFMTSRISPRAGVLAELVVEPESDNGVGVDLERLLFNYSVSDSLNFSVGRY